MVVSFIISAHFPVAMGDSVRKNKKGGAGAAETLAADTSHFSAVHTPVSPSAHAAPVVPVAAIAVSSVATSSVTTSFATTPSSTASSAATPSVASASSIAKSITPSIVSSTVPASKAAPVTAPASKYKEFSKAEIEKIYKHYNRKEILDDMVRCSQNKEVVGSFGGVGYAKRPNIIEYPQDILAEVKRGITSFHASEELWSNPLSINTELKRGEIDQLRIGWDLILDIDCKELDYSKIAADFIIKALSFSGIKSISCKFSGNHGFHIAVPWEAFPKSINGKETRLLFPEAPRAIAAYLKSLVERKIGQALMEYERAKQSSTSAKDLLELMIKKCDLDEEQANLLKKSFIYQQDGDGEELAEFDAFQLVGIDTILIASRHLYRQVYSVNEKSGLVSIPINPFKILAFEKKIANIDYFIFSKFRFLDRENRENIVAGEASELLINAYDYVSKIKRDDEMEQFQADAKKKETASKYADLTEKIPKEFFPPQIQKLLGPLQDGKKRAMFILISFLRCVGYTSADIEVIMREWNEKHSEPIRETFFRGQLKSGLENPEKIPPPNYDPQKYTTITGIPIDPLEMKMRNPIAYAKAKYSTWIAENNKPKRVSKKKKETAKTEAADIPDTTDTPVGEKAEGYAKEEKPRERKKSAVKAEEPSKL